MPRNPKLTFNMEKMYFGKPYTIDLESAIGSITVYAPTIGDLIQIGNDRFFSTLNIFICNTTQYRLPLWEAGIDWTAISDFELFTILYKGIDPEVSKLIFRDLDFSKFERMIFKKNPIQEESTQQNKEFVKEDLSDGEGKIEDAEKETKPEEEIVLFDRENNIEINYDVYNHFSQYLQTMFGIFPEEKITNSEYLKQMYIEKDKRERSNNEWKKKHDKEDSRVTLQSTISACVNHPGFKYKLSELEQVGVAEFYDSVRRLITYEQTTALMKGMYSGFVDSSGIKPRDYDFMRNMYN